MEKRLTREQRRAAEVIKMYVSLQEAVHVAGGCGYGIELIRHMTILELITTLAPNKVEFIHFKQKQKIAEEARDKALKPLLDYLIEGMDDLRRDLEKDNSNIVAATILDTYEAIVKKLMEGKPEEEQKEKVIKNKN